MTRGEPGQKSGGKSIWLILGLVALCPAGLACVGIGAAVAIPAFLKYQLQSKSSEARANVRTLGMAVEAHCAGTGALPGAAGPLPATPRREKQVVAFSADPVFASLGWGPADPVYYSYALEPTATGVDVVARGDLDDDGVLSVYRSSCHTDPCRCGSASVTDELE